MGGPEGINKKPESSGEGKGEKNSGLGKGQGETPDHNVVRGRPLRPRMSSESPPVVKEPGRPASPAKEPPEKTAKKTTAKSTESGPPVNQPPKVMQPGVPEDITKAAAAKKAAAPEAPKGEGGPVKADKPADGDSGLTGKEKAQAQIRAAVEDTKNQKPLDDLKENKPPFKSPTQPPLAKSEPYVHDPEALVIDSEGNKVDAPKRTADDGSRPRGRRRGAGAPTQPPKEQPKGKTTKGADIPKGKPKTQPPGDGDPTTDGPKTQPTGDGEGDPNAGKKNGKDAPKDDGPKTQPKNGKKATQQRNYWGKMPDDPVERAVLDRILDDETRIGNLRNKYMPNDGKRRNDRYRMSEKDRQTFDGTIMNIDRRNTEIFGMGISRKRSEAAIRRQELLIIAKRIKEATPKKDENGDTKVDKRAAIKAYKTLSPQGKADLHLEAMYAYQARLNRPGRRAVKFAFS